MSKKRFMNDNWDILPIDDTKNYMYKSVHNTPWGVYELSDGWYYNVGYTHSSESYATKELALETLYKIYRQVYLKRKP